MKKNFFEDSNRLREEKEERKAATRQRDAAVNALIEAEIQKARILYTETLKGKGMNDSDIDEFFNEFRRDMQLKAIEMFRAKLQEIVLSKAENSYSNSR
ncbi:MAG: hypothetical protein JSS53_06790 [Proteobacteria bacterium]|nr:hypothetical protein [Pseudomonadota bacterium]